MRLILRKNRVCVFAKSASWDDGVAIFVDGKRFDITKEQFDALAEAAQKGGTEGFVSCCLSLGITIDKNHLN